MGIRKRLKRGFRKVSDVAAKKLAQRPLGGDYPVWDD